jgi:hypothetical protein
MFLIPRQRYSSGPARCIRPMGQGAAVDWLRRCNDGMNLVAKESVAARHDERGVLILSCFIGSAHELRHFCR